MKKRFPLNDASKKEQSKFFRLCSASDHQKLIRKEPMSINDFDRITFLLNALEYNEYLFYVEINFSEQLHAFAERERQLDYFYDNDGMWFDYELDDRINNWLKEFCIQMKNKKVSQSLCDKYGIDL